MASIASIPLIMEVNPSVPVKSVPEFIAYAKANPAKINMASGGIGSPAHVAGELFKMMAGINMVHVPYRGERATLNAALSKCGPSVVPSSASAMRRRSVPVAIGHVIS